MSPSCFSNRDPYLSGEIGFAGRAANTRSPQSSLIAIEESLASPKNGDKRYTYFYWLWGALAPDQPSPVDAHASWHKALIFQKKGTVALCQRPSGQGR
jgi:hypothetical protein